MDVATAQLRQQSNASKYTPGPREIKRALNYGDQFGSPDPACNAAARAGWLAGYAAAKTENKLAPEMAKALEKVMLALHPFLDESESEADAIMANAVAVHEQARAILAKIGR